MFNNNKKFKKLDDVRNAKDLNAVKIRLVSENWRIST